MEYAVISRYHRLGNLSEKIGGKVDRGIGGVRQPNRWLGVSNRGGELY